MGSPELIVLVGIQASGKTTYFRRHLVSDYLHVSLDNWRGKGNIRRKEYQAILAGLRQAADGLTRGVVVDNTNSTAATRRRYFDNAEEFRQSSGRTVRVLCYFFPADLEACLKRNEQRPPPQAAPPGEPYFVPPNVIADYARRLEPPTYQEGFEEIYDVRLGANGDFRVRQRPRP